MATRKCDYCGKEGNVPAVRGANTVGVQLGNFRRAMTTSVVLCADCARGFMDRALDAAADAMGLEGERYGD